MELNKKINNKSNTLLRSIESRKKELLNSLLSHTLLTLKNKKVLDKKGLGLLEVIIALAVVVTGVVSGLTLTTYNLSSSASSETRLIAANLAREGIEVIRYLRDSNWLADNDWDQGIFPSGNYRASVNFDSFSNSWTTVAQSNDIADCDLCKIYLDETEGLYTHDISGTLTSYKRLITKKDICWQDAINQEVILDEGAMCSDYSAELVGWELKSELTWLEFRRSHQISVVDKLYDWR